MAPNAVGQFPKISPEKTLAVLLDDDHMRHRPNEFIVPSPWNPKHLHYIPSSRNTLEIMREKLFAKIGRERRLARLLDPLRADYNFVIIDTGPANDVLTQNALVVSDFVVVPVNLDFLGLEAINRTLQMIKVVQLGLDQETPKILGLLGTFYRKGVYASEEALQILQNKFSASLIRSVVPLNSAIPDSFAARFLARARRYHGGQTAAPGTQVADLAFAR